MPFQGRAFKDARTAQNQSATFVVKTRHSEHRIHGKKNREPLKDLLHELSSCLKQLQPAVRTFSHGTFVLCYLASQLLNRLPQPPLFACPMG